jgi:hypothetical protein
MKLKFERVGQFVCGVTKVYIIREMGYINKNGDTTKKVSDPIISLYHYKKWTRHSGVPGLTLRSYADNIKP